MSTTKHAFDKILSPKNEKELHEGLSEIVRGPKQTFDEFIYANEELLETYYMEARDIKQEKLEWIKVVEYSTEAVEQIMKKLYNFYIHQIDSYTKCKLI